MCLVRMDRRNVDRSGETDGIGINSKVLAASLVSTDGYKSVGKSMSNKMLLQGPLKCDYLPITDGDQGWLNRNGSSDYSDTHFSDPMSADILDENESSNLEIIMVSKPASVNKLLNNSSLGVSSDSHPMATAFVSSEPQNLELSVYEYCKQLIDNPSEKLEKFVKDKKEMSKIENASVQDIDCCKPSGAESFDQSQGPVRKCGIIRRKKTQPQLNGILTKPMTDYFSPISTNNSMKDLKESNVVNSANPSFRVLTVNTESSSNLTKQNIPDLPVNDMNSTINTSMISTATPDVEIEVDPKPPRDILSEKEKKAALPQSTSLDMPVHRQSSCVKKDSMKVEEDSIILITSSESHENNTPIKTSTEENSASTSNAGERYTSPKFSASKGPRAKKSISFHFKETTQESPSPSVARDILTTSVASPASDSNIESKSIPNMTIKVGELENALGLHFKSLDKLDAKTLDKIVLAMAQENSKTRSGAKFGSSSRHSKRSERATLFNKTVLAAASSAGAAPQPQNSPSKPSNPVRESGSSSGLLAAKAASPNPNGNSCLNQQKNCSARKSVVHPVSEIKNVAGKCDNPTKPFSSGTITNGHTNSKSEGPFSSRRKIQKARKTQGWSFDKPKLLSLSSSNCENSLEEEESIVGTLSRLSGTNGLDDVGSVGTGKKKFANLRKSSERCRRMPSAMSSQDRLGARARSKRRRLTDDQLENGSSSIDDERGTKTRRVRSSTEDSFTVPWLRPARSEVVVGGQKSKMYSDSQSTSQFSQSETASISSSSSVDNLTITHRSQRQSGTNKITYPVTPPITPEYLGADEIMAVKQIDPSVCRDVVRPCSCRVPGVISDLVTHCQALDSFDGKVIGCSSRVTNFELLRPSPNTPFIALCEQHRVKLKQHQCCPGCGQFCTQGTFFQCKNSACDSVHNFHKQCQTFANNKYFCPHCGVESIQLEDVHQATERRSASFCITNEATLRMKNGTNNRAKISLPTRVRRPKGDGSVYSATDSVASSKNSTPDEFGLSKKDLQMALAVFSGERVKKVRACPKSLCLACKSGDVERVVYMLAEGMDPGVAPDEFSQPALHIASKHGHHEIVLLLLKAGALPNAMDKDLHTALMEASEAGRLSVIDLLIKAGSVVDARAHDGMTALHLAAKSGQCAAIQRLLESRQISVNVKDDGGWTALIWATEHKHSETVRYLLSMGADPNIKDNELNTALHWAAYAGSVDIATMFLAAGCDIECPNDHGDRPLHITARQDHYECAVILMIRGADVRSLNKADQMPINCCFDEDCKLAVSLKMQAANLKPRPIERIIHWDISLGRETNPVMVVNEVDSENYPNDFLYVVEYVESTPINVNRLITSLATCKCQDNCSSSLCNCTRSSIKCWYDKSGHLAGDFSFAEPPLLFECNKACRCYSNCHNRVVQLGVTCSLQVFRTNGRGWGCRTLRDISQGTFVCEYFGELISDEEADRREDDSYLFDLDNQESDTFCIDAARYGNVSRFINHLCEPNLIPVKVFVDHQDLRFPRMCFFAKRDIKANEELGFDYGDKFWVIKWKYFTCSCASSKCRYSKDTILKTLEEYHKRQSEMEDEEGEST